MFNRRGFNLEDGFYSVLIACGTKPMRWLRCINRRGVDIYERTRSDFCKCVIQLSIRPFFELHCLLFKFVVFFQQRRFILLERKNMALGFD